MTQYESEQLLYGKHIYFDEGGSVDASIVVSSICNALSRLKSYKEDLGRVIDKCTILYVFNDPKVHTICVDERMNVYISVDYVYSVLKMDEILICALLHNAISHFKSDFNEEKWFLSHGMPKGWKISSNGPVLLTLPIHHSINIATDIRINNEVLRSESIDREAMNNQMNAVTIKEHESLLMRNYYHNTELMDKLKQQVGKTFPLTPRYKDDPMTYFSGYKQTIGDIINQLDLYRDK